jgi:Ca2+-binding RTX toxin-like protein
VTLVGGATTTAYDMAFAHDEIGIRDADDGTIDFENGNKALKGTEGADSFDVAVDGNADQKARDWSLTGNGGNDVLRGNDGDDMISGGAGADKLRGERSDDLIVMDAADTAIADAINGGLGYDIVMVEGAAGVSLNLTLAEVEAFYGGEGNDVVTSTGSLGVYANGGDGNDGLYGSAEGDYLIGGAGNDTLSGGDEGDYLHGGEGIDALYGGAGDDVVVADTEDSFATGKVLGGAGYDTLIVTGEDTTARTFNLQAMQFEGAVVRAGRRRLAAPRAAVYCRTAAAVATPLRMPDDCDHDPFRRCAFDLLKQLKQKNSRTTNTRYLVLCSGRLIASSQHSVCGDASVTSPR